MVFDNPKNVSHHAYLCSPDDVVSRQVAGCLQWTQPLEVWMVHGEILAHPNLDKSLRRYANHPIGDLEWTNTVIELTEANQCLTHDIECFREANLRCICKSMADPFCQDEG